MTDPTTIAEHLGRYATTTGKPVLASWMGGRRWTRATEILNRAGIPTFPYPDTAAKAFTYIGTSTANNLAGLYETPCDHA